LPASVSPGTLAAAGVWLDEIERAVQFHAITLPFSSMPASSVVRCGGAFVSHCCTSERIHWIRTGAPTCCDRNAASMPPSSASLRP